MRSVSIRQLDMKQATIPLGFEGENEFTEVRIDCKKTFDQHPDAVPSMTVTDPAGNKYPAVVTRDGDVVVWQLTAGDLTTKGYGEIQIEFLIDGTVIGKTDIARTRIERSIFPEGEAPEPMQNWLDDANQTLAEVEEAKQAFPAGGTTGQVLTKKSDADYDTDWEDPQGGGGGTSNYNDLDNKPSINGVTLTGNKSLSDLSIPSQEDVNAKYTKPQGGIPASDIDPSAIPSPTSIIDDNAGEGDTNKVLSADKVIEITAGLSEAIASESELLDERTLYPTVNLYDPSKQTSETISPHYFVSGVPYSTTQFDSTWNCTAPIPVKPSTSYAIGLVPAVDDTIVKPWNTAAFGWFTYDKDGNYISQGNSNVFTTPANAAYIRFNYYIALNKISLDVLKQKCVIIEGNELPESYIAYSHMTIKEKVETIGGRVNYVIHDGGEGVTLIAKYNALNDIAITLEKTGGNNLFDFHQFGLIGNQTKEISRTADSQTPFLLTGTDWFGPFVVRALNNIDGDSTGSDTFTGGNHQYNNQGSGSTPTARGTALSFKADNMAVSSGSGSCSRFEMDWTNLVQATNTKKADGTGREVLQENHRLIFDGEQFEFFVDVIPFEDVKMMIWYGAQWSWKSGDLVPYPKVRYIGGANREEYDCSSAGTSSGDNSCNHAVGYGDAHEIRLDIDGSYDLGDHKYYPSNYNQAMFTATYGKGYCNFFAYNDLDEGAMYSIHGWYKFKSRT